MNERSPPDGSSSSTGYLREHRFTTQARGRAAIVLQPLHQAYEAVSRLED